MYSIEYSVRTLSSLAPYLHTPSVPIDYCRGRYLASLGKDQDVDLAFPAFEATQHGHRAFCGAEVPEPPRSRMYAEVSTMSLSPPQISKTLHLFLDPQPCGSFHERTYSVE
jgi:hypothetical protein